MSIVEIYRVTMHEIMAQSLKDHDGPNDRRANLSRPDVYRLAFGLTRTTFCCRLCTPEAHKLDNGPARRPIVAELFGDVPARPPKGGVVALSDQAPRLTAVTTVAPSRSARLKPARHTSLLLQRPSACSAVIRESPC